MFKNSGGTTVAIFKVLSSEFALQFRFLCSFCSMQLHENIRKFQKCYVTQLQLQDLIVFGACWKLFKRIACMKKYVLEILGGLLLQFSSSVK